MESTNSLEKNLALMEDWYKTVIFDNDGKILATKNASKVDEKELV
jgi:hypothetical protein